MPSSFHRPRKRFGQHFLHDPRVLARIVDALRLSDQDCVVEIGPGEGALTRLLLERVKQLNVVEIDRDLAARLSDERITVHQADALEFDFARFPAGMRVVGNLPYNISTPLLFHLLDQAECIQDMLFMLQKEVVDRLAAEPGGADYGRLSVMVQWRCHVERLFSVPASAFSPPPQVESAVVRLTPYRQAPVVVDDANRFQQIVLAAFAQRRKVLRNSVGGLVRPELFERAGIDPTRRAETLSLAEFATLANLAAGPEHSGDADGGSRDKNQHRD